jgi:outer membrane beta-barrel protein
MSRVAMGVRSHLNVIITVATVMVSCFATNAWADEGELVEKVAVRNRLYTVKGRFELGVNVGLSLLPMMNEHYNFTASVAYNLAEFFALELRAGYAYATLTSLGQDVRGQQQTTTTKVSDLANMWRMTFNGLLGLRFQPFYGKLNLVAELPIHFQFYLWLGGGVGLFNRESAVFCNTVSTATACNPDSAAGRASNFVTENNFGPLFAGSIGFRLFIAMHHAFRIEVRNYLYLDSYKIDATRGTAMRVGPWADGTTVNGVTNVGQIDFGYSYIF